MVSAKLEHCPGREVYLRVHPDWNSETSDVRAEIVQLRPRGIK